jgi:DNA primase
VNFKDAAVEMRVIDEVKERTDIVEIVGETVKLKKSGKNFTGFCPFHSNTRTPAFVVFPDTGTWRCFGACNEGGDVFSFLMKKEAWDFPETLRYLAQRAGVEIQPVTPQAAAEEEENARLREALEAANTFFRNSLHHSEAGREVLRYLHERDLRDEALETFELGYAPQGWENTLSYLTERGFSQEELMGAGLVTERDQGGFYDRFRHRITIPIRDARGRLAGFGARVVDPQDVPKFINSPQTSVFDKSRLLYGLDKARRAIRRRDQAVIVEGYMDVIALHQAGFENTVSPMGTALSEHQLRMLKRYSRRMVLALDPDQAGSQATLRGLTVARETLDRELDPVFDARGLVRHEGRLDADMRIISLPEGKDPDEVAAEDPDAWGRLLEGAQTVVDYVIEVLSDQRDLSDSKVKADLVRQIMPLIEDVADPVEREAYKQNLARHLQLDERTLHTWRSRATRSKSARAERGSEDERARHRSPDSPLERFCLGVLLRDPEQLYKVDRELQRLSLERLSVQDFSATEHQVLYQAARDALKQDEEEPGRAWRFLVEDSLLDVADRALAEVIDLDFNRTKVSGEVAANFLRLRMRRLDARLTHLRFQLQAAQELAPEERDELGDVWDHTRAVQSIAVQKESIDRALARSGGAAASASAVEKG